MARRPNAFASHAMGDVSSGIGSRSTALITSSDVVRKAKAAPIARSEVEAKKAVPFCRPATIDVSTMRPSRRDSISIHIRRCRFIAAVSVRPRQGLMSTSQE